jgi:hypothetical protein
MSWILDNKNTIGSYIIPTGNTNKITVFGESLIINSGIDFNFKQIIDTETNYLLTDSDYAIEIISDTYNTITLPSALNIGGRTYIISRGSTNNNLILQAQIGETIDSRNIIQLKRINDHIKVMSNNISEWYVI